MNDLLKLLIIILILVPGKSIAQKSRTDLENQRKLLEQEINETTQKIKKAQTTQKNITTEITLINKNINDRKRLIESLTKEIQIVDLNLEQTTKEIKRYEKMLEANKKEYEKLLLNFQIYTNQPNDLLQFLFASKSFNQALLHLKYYRQYKNFLQERMLMLKEIQTRLEVQQKELSQQKQTKYQLQQLELEQKNNLEVTQKKKNRLLQDAKKDEAKLKSLLAEKKKAAETLNAAIRKLIEEEAKKAAATSNKSGNKEYKSSDGFVTFYSAEDLKLSVEFEKNQGKLPWPIERGLISEYFGEHPHPVLKGIKVKNNGLNFICPPETPVYSIAKGKVSKIMEIPGMRNVVIIRHGEFLTVYSNLKNIMVKEGEMIAAHTKIGTASEIKNEENAELHFELWKGKTPQNPLPWLSSKN